MIVPEVASLEKLNNAKVQFQENRSHFNRCRINSEGYGVELLEGKNIEDSCF